jgi:hypothetical protein
MSKLFYRIGIPAEASLFTTQRDTYYGFVIRANISALYSVWTTSFIENLQKPYFIDPVTYLLAFDLECISEEGEIKKGYQKMIENYGGLVEKIIIGQGRELIPSDFRKDNKWNNQIIEDITNRVIGYQKTLGKSNLQATLDEIFLMVEKKQTGEKACIEFLIPPYFYFEDHQDPWYGINFEIAKFSYESNKNEVIYPLLLMSKTILKKKESIEKILEDYASFEGLVLWISDFDDTKEDVETLCNYGEFLTRMREKKVVMLYSGFFTCLLSKKYLEGYARNIAFGEKKDVFTQTGGGPAPQRAFYFWPTHTRVSETKIRTIFSMYPEYRCKCEHCKSFGLVETDSFFTALKNKDFKAHFMRVHLEENKLSYEELVNRLKEELRICKAIEVNDFGVSYSHLNRWLRAINEME